MKSLGQLYEEFLLRRCGEANDEIPLAEAAGDRERLNRALSHGAALRGLYADVLLAMVDQVKTAVESGEMGLEEARVAFDAFSRGAGEWGDCQSKWPANVGAGRIQQMREALKNQPLQYQHVPLPDSVREQIQKEINELPRGDLVILPHGVTYMPESETHTVTGKTIEIECGRVRIATDGMGRGKVYFDGVESDLCIVGLKYEVTPGEADKLHLTVNPIHPKPTPITDTELVAKVMAVERIMGNRSAASVIDINDGVQTPVIVENHK